MKNSSNLKTASQRGFTLIELLTVVAIIVILSAITVGAMGWVQKKAAVEKTRAQIALLENGLERYYAATGAYPLGSASGRNSSLAIYKALFGDGVGPDGVVGTDDDTAPDGTPDEGATVFVAELDPVTNPMKMVSPSGKGAKPEELVDSWDEEFNYRDGTKESSLNPDFDLWSSGPDGKTSASGKGAAVNDDIVNW